MKNPRILAAILLVIGIALFGGYQLWAGGPAETTASEECGSGKIAGCGGCTKTCDGAGGKTESKDDTDN